MSRARLLLTAAALAFGCGTSVETSSTSTSTNPTGSGGASTTSASSSASSASSSSGSSTECQTDSDCPAPPGECVGAACVAGKCSVAPLPPATPCKGGCQCDGMGSCAGGICLTDADCGPYGECNTGKCEPCEYCAVVPLPAGTPSPGQSKGDCQIKICNGLGDFMTMPDDGDVPDDGDPCTIDKCVNGAPVHEPKCPPPQTCNQGVCWP